jgi:hypothetical protein
MTTKSDAESDLVTLISPEQLERLRRQKREPREEKGEGTE